MHRIFIGSFAHETNTFWPAKTEIEAFRNRYYVTGQALVKTFEGTETPLGAFLDVLRESGAEGIFSVAASAEPSGHVSREAYEEITGILLDDLASAADRIDGVLLALHGAMVAEHEEDGEGALLEKVRKLVGPGRPVIVTLDLHANITKRMADNTDAMIPFHEYPHIDGYDRGLDAARMMIRTLDGEIRPVTRFEHPHVLASLTETMTESYAPIAKACEEARKIPGVLEAAIAHGFFPADIPDAGVTALAVTDGDAQLAERVAKELSDTARTYRERISRIPTLTPEQAIAEAARTKGTVVFADVCDNPGAGSSCDGTKLLRAMLDAGVRNAAMAIIADAESVEACRQVGAGSWVDLRLGGKAAPEQLGAPIECRAYVKKLSDGKYVNKGPMQAGLVFDMQGSAVIEVGGVTVIVGSVAKQPYDAEVFRSHGLEPGDFHILAVKSSVHYRASFGPIAEKMLSVECPGILVTDPCRLTYRHVRRPVYPLDEIGQDDLRRIRREEGSHEVRV